MIRSLLSPKKSTWALAHLKSHFTSHMHCYSKVALFQISAIKIVSVVFCFFFLNRLHGFCFEALTASKDKICQCQSQSNSNNIDNVAAMSVER